MTEFEHLLRDRIGLDAATIGSSAIQRTIRLRMKSLGLKQAEDYKQLLQTSTEEWNELVESMVVTETWFFRDQEPFAALVRLVRNEWLARQPAEPLRLLSLPCSSGEEPYSLAMTLLEAGVPSEHFHIDAVDISSRALAKARRGVYGRNSFRGQELEFRNRWFQPVQGGCALAPDVRRCVRFTQANVLEPEFLAQQAPYDFIFCRNLLIYFDALTRKRALEKIQRALSPAGVLFVGAAEQPLVLDYGFVSANLPLAFACRKADPAPGAAQPAAPRRALPVKAAVREQSTPVRISRGSAAAEREKPSRPRPGSMSWSVAGTSPGEAPSVQGSPRPAGETLRPEGEPDLRHARRLADAGQLKEAAALCEAHLQQRRTSAAGWYLLGLVREAAGDTTAGDCYRKALYLEPDHYESLLQLALLAEKNGDTARARTYKRRAQRSQSQRPSNSA